MQQSHPFNLASFISYARAVGSDVQSVEVKEAVAKLPKSMAETVSAFANGSGGTVVLGISEREGFAPVKGFDARKAADALAQCCSDMLEPPVRADIVPVPFEGATVVVGTIAETAPYLKPCYVKSRTPYGGSFIRTGDGDRQLSRYEVDRILEERRQPTYDEDIVTDATVDDLNRPLLAGLLQKERASSPFVFGSLNDDEAMLSLKVMRRDAEGVPRPTLAAIMALGNHPQHFFPRCNVTFAVIPGTSKADISADGARFLDSRTIIGPVPVMVSEAMRAVRGNLRMASYVKGAGRVDVPELPELAVREAISNALVHRDYSPEGCGTQVQVNLYTDRLEVSNPGGLYGAVTIDRLGELDVSASRNQLLSRLLESTPFPAGYPEEGHVVENKGTGYFQMRRSMLAAHKPPPAPYDNLSSFHLALYRADVPPEPVDLGETDRTVLEVLGTGRLNSRTIAERVGKSYPTVSRSLKKLVEGGLVRRLPRDGRGVRYELT